MSHNDRRSCSSLFNFLDRFWIQNLHLYFLLANWTALLLARKLDWFQIYRYSIVFGSRLYSSRISTCTVSLYTVHCFYNIALINAPILHRYFDPLMVVCNLSSFANQFVLLDARRSVVCLLQYQIRSGSSLSTQLSSVSNIVTLYHVFVYSTCSLLMINSPYWLCVQIQVFSEWHLIVGVVRVRSISTNNLRC